MISKPKLILIGGGGHCKSCIDVIESNDNFIISGILDLADRVGDNNYGYPIIGTDEEIPALVSDGYSFLITIGVIRNAQRRVEIYDGLKRLNASLPLILSSSGIVSKHSKVAEGTIIMHHAIINAGAAIGSNCIINNKALIEHDSIVGSYSHISTSAIVNGDCEIGEKCYIGSGVIINQGIKIVNNVVIGAGTVVTKNLEESGVYVGKPAKKIK